ERATIIAVLAIGLRAHDLHDLAADLDVQARAGAFAALGPLGDIVAGILIRIGGRPAPIPITFAFEPGLTEAGVVLINFKELLGHGRRSESESNNCNAGEARQFHKTLPESGVKLAARGRL